MDDEVKALHCDGCKDHGPFAPEPQCFGILLETRPSNPDAVKLAEACKPWEHSVGDPPDWESPLLDVFDAGINYGAARLAETLGVTDYEWGDGSDDYATDVARTFTNVLKAAGFVDADGDLLDPKSLRQPYPAPENSLADPWGDEVSALVDAAFETVSRNPSDHETALAYRRAILAALRQQPNPADEAMVLLREAINDGIATLAAVRATAASDEWADSAAHFHNLCGQTIRRMNAALSPPTEGER